MVWLGSYLAWFGLVWLGGVNEEEVAQTKGEVQPVVEETGREGL